MIGRVTFAAEVWPKLGFSTKISKIWIFDKNLNFWPKFAFLTKIWIFDQHFDFCPKFRPKFWYLTNILIFDQNFDFWPKFRFLSKILIFVQHFYFWPKLDFCQKFRFLTKKSIFLKFVHKTHFTTANFHSIRSRILNSQLRVHTRTGQITSYRLNLTIYL